MLVRFLVLIFMFVYCMCMGTKDYGPPAGFLSECPGMNRTTKLSEQTKRTLSVVAIKSVKGGFLTSSEVRCSLDEKGTACVAAHLDLTKKLQIVISGYLDSSSSFLVRTVADQYLRRGRNVLVVEIFPVLLRSYPLAARVTKPFGEQLGEFLASLTEFGLVASRLSLVGASLGAHIAHYTSMRFQELTGEKPSRLTGLDPAGPCFRTLPYEARFNRAAAHKVDVLHTNIDGFGIADPLGHVDFYANGGEYQQSLKHGFLLPCLELCSHIRSALYLISAFSFPDKFIAIHCDSVGDVRQGNCYDKANLTSNLLGPWTDFKKPGIYYLPTDETPPYHIGEAAFKKRDYVHNNYLLKITPDQDLII